MPLFLNLCVSFTILIFFFSFWLITNFRSRVIFHTLWNPLLVLLRVYTMLKNLSQWRNKQSELSSYCFHRHLYPTDFVLILELEDTNKILIAKSQYVLHTHEMNFQKLNEDNFNQYKISRYFLFHEIFLEYVKKNTSLFLKIFWCYILWRESDFFLLWRKLSLDNFCTWKWKPISHGTHFCNATFNRFI